MNKYEKPNIDGVSSYRFACIDGLIRFTDDYDYPIAIEFHGPAVLSLDGLDELIEALVRGGHSVLRQQRLMGCTECK